MPTSLTSPVARNAVSATVDSWHLEVARDPATLAVLPAETQFTATVRLRYADGSESSKAVFGQPFSDLSAGAKTALRSFHGSVVTYLRASGVLPAGTDTADL